LGTIPVEGNHLDEKHPLDGAAHLGLGDLRNEFGTLSGIDGQGVTENLQALAPRVVHQEQRDPIVRGEVSGGEQLAVAPVVRESKRVGTYNFQKSRPAPPMLKIGPAGFIHRRQVETIPTPDEVHFLFGECVLNSRALDGRRISIVVFPGRLNRIGGGEFVKFGRHDGVDASPRNQDHLADCRPAHEIFKRGLRLVERTRSLSKEFHLSGRDRAEQAGNPGEFRELDEKKSDATGRGLNEDAVGRLRFRGEFQEDVE
jgi:hypothetical protein